MVALVTEASRLLACDGTSVMWLNGDELEVLSTDKGSAADIPEWVNKVGHQHLGTREENGVWHVTVRKAK